MHTNTGPVSSSRQEPEQPGIHVERREVIQLAGLSLALPLFASRHLPLHPAAADDQAFDAFCDRWRDLTAQLVQPGEREAPGRDLDLYMHRLAGEVSSLPFERIPPLQRKVFENERITTGPAWVDGGGAIFIVQIRMEPGAVILPHDHPNHVVATSCLEGASRCDHYELVGQAPAREDRDTSFRVQRTRSDLLSPGRTSHLSRTRDNVHTFEAGEEGAVLVDFTIEVDDSGGAFAMIDVDAEPVDAFQRIHRARWMDVKF